jgi:hypothetical protein
MAGEPPATFTGDHSKAIHWMAELENYHFLNRASQAVANPANCVAHAITLIQGPAVNGWACQRMKWLQQVTQGQQQVDNLWEAFRTRFLLDFTDIAVTVLWPHRSGRPAWPSTSSSNTSSGGASQSALQAVTPDTPDRRTAWVLAACRAARQERYDKSAFPARLAEALQRHGMAVRVGCTSTHVMQGIINELARLQRT